MFKWFLLFFLLITTPVWAQNPTCPTRPPGDSSNACASTAFVHSAVIGTAYVTTTANLKALSLVGLVTGNKIIKTGYYADGDMPPTVYSLSTSACITDDEGAQISSNTAGNCWIAILNSVLDPRVWGASTNNGTDSRSAFNNAMTYANSVGNNTFIDLAGLAYYISDTVVCSACSYVGIKNGFLFPISTWSGGADPVLSFPSSGGNYGSHDSIRDIFIDVGVAHTANGIYVQSKTSNILYNTVLHTPSYAIKVDDTGTTTNGTQVVGNTSYEWGGSDSQFITQSNFTSAGIWIIGADVQVNFNLPYYAKYPILLGDSSGNAAGNGRYIGNHPFNGCGGVVGCSRVDPYDIFIQAGTGNTFDDLYLDDGIFAMLSDSNSIENVTFAGPVTGTCLSERFLDLSNSVNDIPALHLAGPMTGGVNQPGACAVNPGGAVPILFMGTGTGNWDPSVDTAHLDAWTGAGRVDKSQSWITVSSGVSVAGTFLSNNVSVGSIAVKNPSSVNGATFATNGTNAAMVDDSGNTAFRVDEYGPALHGAAITTVSGCGTSPTISGSNGLGHVVFGTSPSTTCTINFAGANWPSATNVDCIVTEPSNPSDVTSWSASVSALTVNLTAPVATHRLQWQCATEQ